MTRSLVGLVLTMLLIPMPAVAVDWEQEWAYVDVAVSEDREDIYVIPQIDAPQDGLRVWRLNRDFTLVETLPYRGPVDEFDGWLVVSELIGNAGDNSEIVVLSPGGQVAARREFYPIWDLAINDSYVFAATLNVVEVFDRETLTPVTTLGEEIPFGSGGGMGVVGGVLHVEWEHGRVQVFEDLEWSHTIETGEDHIEDVVPGLDGTTVVLNRDFELNTYDSEGALVGTFTASERGDLSGWGDIDADGCGGITVTSQGFRGFWAPHPHRDTGCFVDSLNSTFVGSIAQAGRSGITRGCNPPFNDRFCPDDPATRGEVAAFFARALNLPPTSTDYFTDDDNSLFENAINRLAEAGITRGCNPPNNNHYCPTRNITRGEIAAFFTRALNG